MLSLHQKWSSTFDKVQWNELEGRHGIFRLAQSIHIEIALWKANSWSERIGSTNPNINYLYWNLRSEIKKVIVVVALKSFVADVIYHKRVTWTTSTDYQIKVEYQSF